jgi:predicted metalloendopeptidase
MRKALSLLSLAAAMTLASCATTTPASSPTPSSGKPLIGAHGFDVTGMDTSANACDDFYRYAVGKWREANPLQATYARYGRFEELGERNRETLHTILEEAAKSDAPAGSVTRKLGDFYASCMDETAIEAAGVAPIGPELGRIDAIHDRASLQDEITRLQQRGVAALFRFSAQNDFMNSKQIIAALAQGGTGLPDRDYYLRDDAKFKETRRQYTEHIARMFVLAGEDAARAAGEAERVVALESRLAKLQMPRVEQRDPHKIYHITRVADLRSVSSQFDFAAFLNSIGLTSLETVNVAQPDYLKGATALLDELPLDDWKAYLRWQLLDAAAPTLSSAFVNEDFAFRGKTLSGQQQIQERWKRCVRSTDQNLGGLLGQEYVRRAFTPEAKRKMNALIDNLVAALRADIPTLTWMGPETKKAALGKLAAFSRRIGYPDKWIDYTPVAVSRGSYAENVFNAREFFFRRGVSRVGKPDDPDDWGTFFTPPTVNASYSPSRNSITFPAGILQPPFYDPNADDAYNYGGIGTVIGHEMTHGFDDEGAQFDAEGNLRNWWTAEDLKNFKARAECIANQYSEFNVAPGVNINGKLVTGEAIADLGGATIALAAYEKSLEGRERKTIDGFTPEQRFFLGFAQVWGENMAAEEQSRRALTDPHAQGPMRVNATVSNMPAFRNAFRCAEGSRMVRAADKRCSIW